MRALGEIDAQRAHLRHDRVVMDEFRDCLHAQFPGEAHYALGQRPGVCSAVELANKTAVDLDEIHIQAQQVLEVRVAGTEIVDGDPAAQRLGLVNKLAYRTVILDTFRLQYLEDYPLRQRRVLQTLEDVAAQLHVQQVIAGQVEGKLQVAVGKMRDALVHHTPGDLPIQADLARYGHEVGRADGRTVVVEHAHEAFVLVDAAGVQVHDWLEPGHDPVMLQRGTQPVGPEQVVLIGLAHAVGGVVDQVVELVQTGQFQGDTGRGQQLFAGQWRAVGLGGCGQPQGYLERNRLLLPTDGQPFAENLQVLQALFQHVLSGAVGE